MTQKAIVIGSSGLIGSKLVSLLIEHPDYNQVLVLVRKPSGISHPKVHEIILDFDKLTEYANSIRGDVVFSCLGTTRNKTPEASQYRKVDFTYPLELAKLALNNGIRQFHIVTSLGADANSGSAYLKLKGELDVELKKLPFESLHLYQPSYLTGNRKESRIDDKIMQPLMRLIDPLLIGGLVKYKSISADTVAKAMINQSLKNLKGIYSYPSNQIKKIA